MGAQQIVNSLGLMLDIAGMVDGVMVWRYGLPQDVSRTGDVYLIAERDEAEIAKPSGPIGCPQPAVVPYASPLKLFEYLALGKAVIAPRQSNIEEVLIDGQNSLLFNAAADAALEQGLKRLCDDAALRRRLGEGASSTIGRLGLTWRANAQRVSALAAGMVAAGVVGSPTRSLSATRIQK
jgi:glycosyltransferase involved in cell wall biosynthesis